MCPCHHMAFLSSFLSPTNSFEQLTSLTIWYFVTREEKCRNWFVFVWIMNTYRYPEAHNIRPIRRFRTRGSGTLICCINGDTIFIWINLPKAKRWHLPCQDPDILRLSPSCGVLTLQRQSGCNVNVSTLACCVYLRNQWPAKHGPVKCGRTTTCPESRCPRCKEVAFQ